MFQNKYPLFNSGRLLKIDMLEELRDFPREFFNVQFSEYSNGIIYGCNLEVSNNYITISNGLIKYKHIIYILKDQDKIPYECNNKLMILKIRFLSETKDDDFKINSTEICLEEGLNIRDTEIEVCRFKLRTGAKLRINYTDFEDLNTEYDTVNTIYAPYATYENSSINPDILRRFGTELLECNLNEPWDISFAMMCVQSKEAIQIEIIISYLINKLNIERKSYSNEDIYYYLLEVLKNIKYGAMGNRHRGNGRARKILID